MVWVERDLKDHLVPLPLPLERTLLFLSDSESFASCVIVGNAEFVSLCEPHFLEIFSRFTASPLHVMSAALRSHPMLKSCLGKEEMWAEGDQG